MNAKILATMKMSSKKNYLLTRLNELTQLREVWEAKSWKPGYEVAKTCILLECGQIRAQLNRSDL